MCSSASAAIAHEMQQHFGVSPTLSRLPVAMFLFGLALGPVVLTPLAEVSRIIIGSPRRLNTYLLPGLRTQEGLGGLPCSILRVGFSS